MKTIIIAITILTIAGACYADRYTDNTYILGKYIVVDKTTGLMFERISRNQQSWKDALKYCEKAKTGGFEDWRLPNVHELRSIVSYRKDNPAIHLEAFPDTFSNCYWTSTSHHGDGQPDAIVIDFANGMAKYRHKTKEPCYVRAVRGGN